MPEMKPWETGDAAELRSLPLSLPEIRHQVETFLRGQGLTLAPLSYCAGIFCGQELVALGGYRANTLMNLAVLPEAQGLGLMNRLVDHLREQLMLQGVEHIFVFTKPENRKVLEGLGFYSLLQTETVLFCENKPFGLARFCSQLKQFALENGSSGTIVMNANPFTLGHLYLVETAKLQCDRLHVFVVETEASEFSFANRFTMVSQGVAHLEEVYVHAGGPYMISAGVFPDYFLKNSGEAARVQAELDVRLFGQYIAPALQSRLRFAGAEPLDLLTAQYVEAIQGFLPKYGMEVRIIPRITKEGEPISASRVRHCLKNGQWDEIRKLVPHSTYAYLQKIVEQSPGQGGSSHAT